MHNASEVIFFKDFKPLLEREGFHAFNDFHHAPGRLVDRNRNRDVRQLDPLQDGRRPYLKRFLSTNAQENHRLARSEADRIDRFQRMGFPGPVCAASGWNEREAFLLFLAPHDASSLNRHLRNRPSKAILESLARTLGKLHASGIRLPDLAARHVLVQGDETFYFIDLARLEFGKRFRAVEDLARLFATLESRIFTRTQRLKFVRAYGGDVRRIWKQLKRCERKERRKGRFPEMIPLKELRSEDSKVYIHRDYIGMLPMKEVKDFFKPPSSTELLRDLGVRMNYRVEASGQVYFLKVHREKHKEGLGRKEWRNHLRLMRFEIPCAEPVAWGASGDRTFFMAKACPGRTGETLEGLSASLRRRAARNLGHAVRRLHGAGFYHRDLYLSHVVFDGDACRFIDLQRLEDGPLFARHRRVKDLAALLYSSHDLAMSATDRFRFFKSYRGSGRLDGKAKALLRAVERKALKIAAHDRRRR